VRIIEPFFELILIPSESRSRKLRCHAGFFQPRIRGHKADFIDSNATRAFECALQLLRKLRRLRLSRRKRSSKSCDLFPGYCRKKLHAGKPCG
jgi:hypothetical protein